MHIWQKRDYKKYSANGCKKLKFYIVKPAILDTRSVRLRKMPKQIEMHVKFKWDTKYETYLPWKQVCKLNKNHFVFFPMFCDSIKRVAASVDCPPSLSLCHTVAVAANWIFARNTRYAIVSFGICIKYGNYLQLAEAASCNLAKWLSSWIRGCFLCVCNIH